MSAETEKVTQQDQPTGPPVTAATSVAEIPAPNPPSKTEEKPAGEKVVQAALGPAEPPVDAGPAPATNGGAEEPKPASTEAAEPATLPTAPPVVETKETNGAAKPAEEAVSEAPGPSVTAEPADAKPAETGTETAKPTEPAPIDQAPTAAATSANGEAPKSADDDTEMKEAPSAAAETVTKDGVTAPVGTVNNKRKADDALGPDADANAGGKKAKTAEGETVEAAPPAKAAVAETNGGGAAPAKKGGRPKKQPGKPAPPVGRTERKTRSQGPVV